MSDFKFQNAPRDTGAIICCHLHKRERAVQLIALEEDGTLVMSCGETDHGGAEDWVLAGLWHFNGYKGLEFDSIPNLATGQCIVYEDKQKSWVSDT